MDYSQPRTGEHGDRQLGDHRHVNGDAVSRFQTGKVTKQRRQLIHADIQFLIGDGYDGLLLRLGHEDQCGFIFVLVEVSIDAVVRGVQLSSHKPFPERRLTGVESRVPVLIPAQHVGIFPEALREILLAEPLRHIGVSQVGLADEFWRRIKIFFFPPVNRNLCVTGLNRCIASLANVSHISCPLILDLRSISLFPSTWDS